MRKKIEGKVSVFVCMYVCVSEWHRQKNFLIDIQRIRKNVRGMWRTERFGVGIATDTVVWVATTTTQISNESIDLSCFLTHIFVHQIANTALSR